MNKTIRERLNLKEYPLAASYGLEWLCQHEMGPNALWLVEFLLNDMTIKEGMRILDLGCGKAMTSIFIGKEFKAKVWAVDLWIDATENYKRILDFDLEDKIFPFNLNANTLPFAHEYFDAIVSIDAYHYFGTNEMYLNDLLKFLKPGGQIGIVVPGVKEEFDSCIPERLKAYWEPYLFTHHTPKWWKDLWQRSGCVDIEIADTMPNGYENWLKWDKTLKEAGYLQQNDDVEMLEADGGNFTFTRVIARKKTKL